MFPETKCDKNYREIPLFTKIQATVDRYTYSSASSSNEVIKSFPKTQKMNNVVEVYTSMFVSIILIIFTILLLISCRIRLQKSFYIRKTKSTKGSQSVIQLNSEIILEIFSRFHMKEQIFCITRIHVPTSNDAKCSKYLKVMFFNKLFKGQN